MVNLVVCEQARQWQVLRDGEILLRAASEALAVTFALGWAERTSGRGQMCQVVLRPTPGDGVTLAHFDGR